MTALLLALILSLLLEQGSHGQRMVVRASEANAPHPLGMSQLALIAAVNAGVAGLMGGAITAIMPPNARLLFLAIALSFGAVGFLGSLTLARPVAAKPAKRPSLAGIPAILLKRASENGAFAIAGVAAFTDSPILATVGGTLGGFAGMAPARLLGERYFRKVPLRAIQAIGGLTLLVGAIACAVNALGLVAT